MASLITQTMAAGLKHGIAFSTEIPAQRDAHRRFVTVYPVQPERFSVICYEIAANALEQIPPGRDECADYDVLYLDNDEDLVGAILPLIRQPVEWTDVRAQKIVLRREQGNWRIDCNGRHQASAGSRAEALSFAYASAQDEYEYNGIASQIFLAEDGAETRIDWRPNHDWLEHVDE